MNQIFKITPYFKDGVWAFDDESVGLKGELLVSGIPEILEKAILQFMPTAKNRVTLAFSKISFPGYHVKLEWLREEMEGNWYRWNDLEGWLCPALFKYFEFTPKELYIQLIKP